MKKFKYILLIATATLLSSGLVSCKTDPEENSVDPFITLGEEELTVTKKGTTLDGEPVSLTVNSNIYWELKIDEKDADWLGADTKGGSGTDVINFTIKHNQEGPRQSTLVFETSGNYKTEIVLRQEGVEVRLDYINLPIKGEGSSKAGINTFTQWEPTGIGVMRAQYRGSNAFVDKESASAGYTDASGGNNILFGVAGEESSEFEIMSVGIKKDINFILYFGSVANGSPYDKNELKLFISQDGRLWTRLIYDRSNAEGWERVKFPFFIKGGVDNLYFKFVNSADNKYRIDDIILTEGEGDGHNITFGEDMPESVEAPANLRLLQATTTNVSVEWDELQSDNNRKFIIEIASSEEGPAIQSYEPTFNTAKHHFNRFTFTKLTPDTDYFVRVKTLSTKAGFINSDFVAIPVRTQSAPVYGSEVVLHHNFDGCMWGGDHVLQTWGYRPAGDVPGSTSPDAPMTALRNPNGGGSGNIGGMTGALKESRRFDGWTSTSTYEFPGYVKVGTTSSTNGHITTPALTDIQGTAKLKVSFKLGPWMEFANAEPYEPILDQFKLRIVVEGAGAVDGEDEFTVTEGFVWKDFSVNINGATSATKIKFLQVKQGTTGSRFCLDDVVVEVTGTQNTVTTDKNSVTLGAAANLSDVVSVTASGAWNATSNASWLTLSPNSGSGTSSENVTFTADTYTGALPRNAEVKFFIGNEELAVVNVTQEGLVTPKIEAPANLALLKATTTNVAIGWDQLTSANDRKFQIEIASTADGTAIQAFTPTFGTAKYYLNRFTFAKLTPDTDYFVRVKTIATVTGYDDSDFVIIPVRTEAAPVYSPDVLYAHNFDGCMWAGDHVLQTWGYRPAGSVPGSTPPDAEMTALRDPNGGGTGNIGGMTGALKTSRRFDGWTSTGVYEYPGYIKLGTGSSSGAGTITIPTLGDLDAAFTGTSDIEVSFKLAAWTERSGSAPYNFNVDNSDFKVSIASGSGTIEGTDTFRASDSIDWVEFKVVIRNADASTKIKFDVARPAEFTSGWYRCCLDDLVITKK